MSARPTIIVSSDAPDGPMAVLAETHPDLMALGCDSYEALPGMISDAGAEVVFTIKFDRGSRYPRSALVESQTVRWVSVGGSGTDHLRPWNPARVTVTNSAGVAADMMRNMSSAPCFPSHSACAVSRASRQPGTGRPARSSRSRARHC
ncbi:hypothetical protein RFN29_01750 [Mesorhizobium sp. VK22B]|uniref:D-isomer specific 2-hydroxyacid dehydrogenase catalytic domain-containing protein n=1 Tax=Mesorhizobium captivum TaxID=3072319 RepID=A0ABU4YU01_9HYPH|nr:hypothetical protein [Mesorhizobium sp. VK22B]MDX8490293.1 hypothetical protein [Mesorhizobium sp. VK22B]